MRVSLFVLSFILSVSCLHQLATAQSTPPHSECTLRTGGCEACTDGSIMWGSDGRNKSQFQCVYCPHNSSCWPGWWNSSKHHEICPTMLHRSCPIEEPAWLWGGVFPSAALLLTLLLTLLIIYTPKWSVEVSRIVERDDVDDGGGFGTSEGEDVEPILNRQCCGLYRASRSRAWCLCFLTREVDIEADSRFMSFQSSHITQLLTFSIVIILLGILFGLSSLFMSWRPYQNLGVLIGAALLFAALFSTMCVWRVDINVVDRDHQVFEYTRFRSVLRIRTLEQTNIFKDLLRFQIVKVNNFLYSTYSLLMLFNDGSSVSLLECESLRTVCWYRDRVGAFVGVGHLGIGGKVGGHPSRSFSSSLPSSSASHRATLPLAATYNINGDSPRALQQQLLRSEP